MYEAKEKLRSYIAAQALDATAEERSLTDPYLDYFKNLYRDKLEAVVFYGSCLSPRLRSPTSTPDFIVVTSDGQIPGHSWLMRTLHSCVPPATRTARIEALDDAPVFKYLYLSLRQLDALCGADMKDLFVAGRLSKHVKLLHSRNQDIAGRIIESLVSSVLELVPLVCASLPARFAFPDYVRAFAAISYFSEYRIEMPGKVDSLLDAFSEHFAGVHGVSVAIAESTGHLRRIDSAEFENLTTAMSGRLLRKRLRRSRLRGLMRWPKIVLTVSHWTSVHFGKLQRIDPRLRQNSFARRHPLLYSLPHLFRYIADGSRRTKED